MTTSDDDYIAPVISLFGDRSRAARTDGDAAESSSEGSTVHDGAVEDGWANEAPVESSHHDTRESGSGLPMPEPGIAPVRSLPSARTLPTMRDFTSRGETNDVTDSPVRGAPRFVEQPDVEGGAESSAATTGTSGSSRTARRQARDGFSEISQVSMRALARRGMSSHEMTQFLGTREFESDEIAAEVERLENSQLLDDAALAETLTRTLRERKGLGSAAITAELRRRKIDNEHIQAVVGFERDEEQERATALALKRAPQLRSLDSVTAKRRLSGFLMRKGYSGSVVSAAVNAALAAGSDSSNGPTFR